MKEDLFDKILAKYGVGKNQKKAILEMLYYDTPDGKFHDFYYTEDTNLMAYEEEYEYEGLEKNEEQISINNIYDKTIRKALDERKKCS